MVRGRDNHKEHTSSGAIKGHRSLHKGDLALGEIQNARCACYQLCTCSVKDKLTLYFHPLGLPVFFPISTVILTISFTLLVEDVDLPSSIFRFVTGLRPDPPASSMLSLELGAMGIAERRGLGVAATMLISDSSLEISLGKMKRYEKYSNSRVNFGIRLYGRDVATRWKPYVNDCTVVIGEVCEVNRESASIWLRLDRLDMH